MVHGKISKRKRLDEAGSDIWEALEPVREVHQDLEMWDSSMPENLEGSRTAEVLLEAIDQVGDIIEQIEGALNELELVELPKGFGRD